MRFLSMLKMDENLSDTIGNPPPALFAAIGAFAAEVAREGLLVEQGGLLPSAAGALIHVDNGRLEIQDGPFTEAKELVGGYSIADFRSREEAVAFSRRFMQVHIDTWPGFVGTCEIRQLMEFDGQG